MRRFRAGWALAGRSLRVLRSSPSLVALPVISGVAMALVAALIFAPGLALYFGDRQEAWLIVAGVVSIYALTFVGIFFNVALAAAVAEALEGRETGVGIGVRAAGGKLGAVLGWSLVQGTVGVLVQALQDAFRDNALGQILTALVTVAWGVATFFVIPAIALEGLGPRQAFKRSLSTVRQRWGEAAGGFIGVGAIVLPFLLLVAGLVAGGVAVLGSSEAAAVALFVLAGAVLVGAILLSSALTAILRVVLYRYATDERALGGFTPAELQAAFVPKRGASRGII